MNWVALKTIVMKTVQRWGPLLIIIVLVLSSVGSVAFGSDQPYPQIITKAEQSFSDAQFRQATQGAIQAYRVAQNPNDKLRAARLASAAHLNDQRPLLAQYWLRRAANHVTTPQDALQVNQEFNVVRNKSPYNVNLSFAIAPSDNINGGAAEKYFELGGFEFEFAPSALALSGIEYSGQADLIYKLSESAQQVTVIGGTLYGRTYSLSDTAKQAAPNVSGSDYALVQGEVFVSQKRRLFENLGPTTGSFHLGKTWYGGDPLRRYTRLAVSQDFVLGQNAALTVGGFVEDQIALSNAQTNTQIYNLQGTYAQRLQNQDIVRVTLQSRYNDAAVDAFTYTDSRFIIDYERAQRIWDTKLTFSVGLGYKDYDTYSLSLNGRRDRSVSVGATAVFENMSYYGFSPSLNITASQTQSNVARFTSNGVQARFGFESNF